MARGWYKAKESYKGLPDSDSYKGIAPIKHEKLLYGESVYIDTCPRLLGKDFSEHLTGSSEPVHGSDQTKNYGTPNSPSVVEPEPESSTEPDSSWTKDDIKVWMDDNSIEYNSGDTKADLLIKCEGGI